MTIVHGNKKSNIAICTLWTNAEEVAQILDKDDFFICGNLYSPGGINDLLRTILANPIIRYIIVYGADATGSGKDLLTFFKKGMDENRYIDGSKIVIERELGNSPNDVRKNVGIVDLRGKKLSALKTKVATLSGRELKPFIIPKKFKESKRTVLKVPNERAGFPIRARNFSEAWLRLIDMILKFSVDTPSGQELLNVEALIDSGDPKIPLTRKINTFKSAANFTFGKRLEQKNSVNTVISKLKKGQRNTLISLWSDKDFSSKHGPRLTLLRFAVIDKELFVSAHFRSHDAFNDWPINMYAIRELQKKIADEVGLKPGPINYFSTAPFISKKDLSKAKKTVSKNYKPNFTFNLDPRGAFVIKVKNNEINVTHITAEGQKTGYEFRGKDPDALYKLIFHENLVSLPEHAAYLGIELEKAKMAIKLGKEYVQEEEIV